MPQRNVNSGVDQIQESLAFLSPGSTRETDSLDQQFRDAVGHLRAADTTSSQSSERPGISPASSTTMHGETSGDLVAPQEPEQLHNPNRPGQRDLFRFHGNGGLAEDGVLRVRKRDLIRAKLRRIAFSEPVDEAATTYAHQPSRMFARLHNSRPQRKDITPPSAKENRAIPRKRLESFKTITHLAEGSKELSCTVCWDELRDTINFPCGHVTSCYECSKGCIKCPVCRKLVAGRIKAPRSSTSGKKDVGCGKCGALRDGFAYPCGHICLCFACSKGITQCSLCEKKVERSVRIFWS